MKKLLFALPVVALLAAGCGSTVDNSADQNMPTPTPTSSVMMPGMSPTPTPSTTMSGSMDASMNTSPWKGTLMASDNSAKGKYMINVSGHNVYINTSKDYSSLVGQNVNVNFTGDMMNFSLSSITAQ